MPEILARFRRGIAILFVCGLPAVAAALEPVPYAAVYDVYLDGKLRMETRITFTPEAGHWLLQNRGKGTKGLARFLNVESSEHGRMRWLDESVEPLEFSHHSKVAGRDSRWTVAFDWERREARTEHEDGESRLAVDAGTLDPAALTQQVRMNLERGLSEWFADVVDEDEIDQHRYEARPPEPMQTALGCREVIRVSRIRENSRRFSHGWYAPGLDYLPVRIRHGKEGGREFDLRIRGLTLDGRRIDPGPDCG